MREALAEDLGSTLSRVAELGFRNVELFDFVERADGYASLPSTHRSAAPSGHAMLLGEDAGDVLDAGETIGVGIDIQSTVPAERSANAEDVRTTALVLDEIGSPSGSVDLQLCRPMGGRSGDPSRLAASQPKARVSAVAELRSHVMAMVPSRARAWAATVRGLCPVDDALLPAGSGEARTIAPVVTVQNLSWLRASEPRRRGLEPARCRRARHHRSPAVRTSAVRAALDPCRAPSPVHYVVGRYTVRRPRRRTWRRDGRV
jgi:hypothetical protein